MIVPDSEAKKPGPSSIALLSQSRVRINTYVKRSLYDQAMEIAKEEDETMTYVVREALKRYIKYYKQEEEG